MIKPVGTANARGTCNESCNDTQGGSLARISNLQWNSPAAGSRCQQQSESKWEMKEFLNGDRGCKNFEMWLRLLKWVSVWAKLFELILKITLGLCKISIWVYRRILNVIAPHKRVSVWAKLFELILEITLGLCGISFWFSPHNLSLAWTWFF